MYTILLKSRLVKLYLSRFVKFGFVLTVFRQR